MEVYNETASCPLVGDTLFKYAFGTSSCALRIQEAAILLSLYTPYIWLYTMVYVMAVGYYNSNRCTKHEPPKTSLLLQRVVITWNLFMCIFSTIGSTYTLPFAFNNNVVVTAPVQHLLWSYLYILSKPFEFIDTMLLMMKYKHVTYLHWTHHALTLLYTWWLATNSERYGLVMSSVNFTIHAVMYGYFFLVSLTSVRPHVQKIAKAVTIIQIMQFVFVLVMLPLYAPEMSVLTCVITSLLYIYYFIIFSRFFWSSYYAQERKKQV